MKKLVSFAFAGVLLSACGGGGTNTLPSSGTGSGATPTLHARSAVTFTLEVPAHTQPAAATRKPQYVSTSMLSLAVTLTAQNGSPVSPPQPYAVNVGSCPMVSGIATCSLSVPASAGRDTFTVATYDAAQRSNTPATLTGNVLSTASTSTTVLVNTANTLALTLNGVVHSISLALANATPSTGAAATIPLTVTARDADGNMIIGPGNYTAPITLANSDTSGATTLSTTSVTGPSTAVTIAYTGAPATAMFSASAPGGISATSSSLTSRISRIYIADDTSNTVATFNAAGVPQSTPTFAGSNFNFPQGIAVDRAGNVYVTYQSGDGNGNHHDVVREFDPTGVVVLTISGFLQPEGVTVDAAGNIYVADYGAGDVSKFTPGGTTMTKSQATWTVSTGTSNPEPQSVAIDSSGANIYVVNSGSSNVKEYSSSGGSLVRTITNGISYPYGVVVDAAGTVYVTNEGGYTVTTYAATGASPPVALTIPIQNGTNGVNNLFQVAVDPAGNIYVVTQNSAVNESGVLVYPPGGGSPLGTSSGSVPNQSHLINNFMPFGVAIY